MEALFGLPYTVLEMPNIKIKKPSWFHAPSAMTTFFLVLVSYYLVCGGIIYDIISEPPSVGTNTDENGRVKPSAFMVKSVNGQYIMEGLTSSFMFTLGGLGFIILGSCTHNPSTPKLRLFLISISYGCIIISYIATRIFINIKVPGYLS